jgi:hypothetical protein
MLQLNKKWKLFVIHHSHTDIGYTERQEKIEMFHVDFIKQAIDILNKIHSGEKKEWTGFKWTCESFWCVERFLKNADKKYIEKFEEYVKSGDIELSASYLNLTEIINYDILKSMTEKSVVYGKKLGVDVKSAMTADINGYSWGYSDALVENGVENLFSCIHTHHGMFPLRRKQIPFWWETPKGKRLLVWNGEYYHIGNELGIAEDYETTYVIKDEFKGRPIKEEQWDRAQKRIIRYMAQLEKENYPYDFVPVMVSGVITDNAPPSGRVVDFINKWNAEFGEQIEIEMTSLTEFFDHLREQREIIPTYKGDWTDWWADGVGSTPSVLKHFRDAQRKYNLCKLLDPEQKLGDKELMSNAEYNLMMYSEHTWGYSSSVSEPWNSMVNDLDMRKSAFAINANESVYRNLDKILVNKGEALLYPDRSMRFKVINSFDNEVCDIAKLYIGYWEMLPSNYEVVEEDTGVVLLHQLDHVARGTEINVLINLKPKEEKVLLIRESKQEQTWSTVKNFAETGSEGVRDLLIVEDKEEIIANYSKLETPFFKLEFKKDEGIVSFVDKSDNKELLRNNRTYNIFTPVYEISEIKTNPLEERRKMGRNRKNTFTKRYAGILTGVEVRTKGDLFVKVELKFQVEGTSYYSVMLTAYKHLPRVDAAVRLNKDSVWEPENLYISLPLQCSGSNKDELWIEKTGCILRPGIDQLPGSGMDFYSIQEGLSYISDEKAIVVGVKDTPLIHLGELQHHPIALAGDTNENHNLDELYSWVMNNFWETNFKATVGGFYEFNYHIYVSKDIDNPHMCKKLAHMLNQGIVTIQIK